MKKKIVKLIKSKITFDENKTRHLVFSSKIQGVLFDIFISINTFLFFRIGTGKKISSMYIGDVFLMQGSLYSLSYNHKPHIQASFASFPFSPLVSSTALHPQPRPGLIVSGY